MIRYRHAFRKHHHLCNRAIQSQCTELSDLKGNITEIYPGPVSEHYSNCWIILNPENQLLKIELKQIDFMKKYCSYVYLSITARETNKTIQWCDNKEEKKPFIVYSSVKVYFFVQYYNLNAYEKTNFDLHYNIDDSVHGIEGFRQTYERSVDWLKFNATSWKWISHIPKAVTALALSGGAAFDGKILKEELMLKQRELRTSVSLLRDSISSEQLSTFINSILSTCHNPRNFYGHHLVELLKKQVSNENVTQPANYLALCNANETWPDKAWDDILGIYESTSSMAFIRDYQAFAVMAVSCKFRRSGNRTIPRLQKLMTSYEKVIDDFKKLQNTNGGFGNVHRSALITQALIASGHSYDDDWSMRKAVKYLIQSTKASSTDFLLTYLLLPILNEKTLVDITLMNCSSRVEDDLVVIVHDYLGPKIQVQYSLFVGDNKDIIHTVKVKVPKYFTALDVMKYVAIKDKQYKFKYELVSGKMDIYEVANIPNEPEDGHFWLFYKSKAINVLNFEHVSAGPDDTNLSEGDHIAMWYKKAFTLI